MKGARGWVTVVGIVSLALSLPACGADEPDTSLEKNEFVVAAQQYRSVLEKRAAKLVAWVAELADAVDAGNLPRAQSRYASARVPYGQLKTLAVSSGNLDLRMNGQANEVPADRFDGFHLIERTLWTDGTPDRLMPVVDRLVANTRVLRSRARTIDLHPVRIANSINKVLDQASSSAIVGKEEPHSHIDLVDIAAEIEGVEAAFVTLKPLLADQYPDLMGQIELSFEKTYVALSDFGVAARDPDQPRPESPGTSFVLFIERSEAEHRRLGQQIAGLAGLLSKLPAYLAQRSNP